MADHHPKVLPKKFRMNGHTISSTDSKDRMTLNVSESGSERVKTKMLALKLV